MYTHTYTHTHTHTHTHTWIQHIRTHEWPQDQKPGCRVKGLRYSQAEIQIPQNVRFQGLCREPIRGHLLLIIFVFGGSHRARQVC
jgi:hypothetical protein